MDLELSENNKFLIIRDSTEMEYEQLKSSFTKKVEGWRFHPLVKRGIWNGEISFIKGNKLPSGLWKEAKDIFQEFDLSMNISGINKLFDLNIKREELLAWSKDFFEGYEKSPRDYQIETAYRILKYRRCLAELATSAGKSLIVFIVIGYILEKKLAQRVLLIVPNVSLVIQASEDFIDYNHTKRLPLKIQQIYAGTKIRENANLVVGTYQSLVKKDEEYFKQFDAVIVDECLHPDTLITMSDGTDKKIKDIKIGDNVKTINEKTGNIESKEVEYIYKNLSKNNQMYEIELENGKLIKITGNHKVKLTSGNWKRVDKLNEDDDILEINNK